MNRDGNRKRFRRSPDTNFVPLDDLDDDMAQKEIEALRDGIHFHDHNYYVKNAPVIADSVYDKLFHRLQQLEQAFPRHQSENSPTQRVGAPPVDKLHRVEHAAPMLSLRAVLERKELDEFVQRLRRQCGDGVRYVVEPKFDGVSVELVYEHGRFRRGSTRGDGRSGDDVTANLRTIGSVPLTLLGDEGFPNQLAVRGEVFIARDAFQQLNRHRIEHDEPPFANARNAAAGILRRLESHEVARYPLKVVVYDLLKMNGRGIATHWDELKQFKRWGFKTDPHVARCAAGRDVAEFHERLEKQRDNLPYDIDGIVIKVDDRRLWQKLGSRHRSPRGALAWKFSPREEVTRLEDIVVQVGRTGKLTPVALLQPVDVGGVTVSRVTLHNQSEIHNKDVRPGDLVRIARAGDVIPEVVERIKQPGKKRPPPFEMPKACPVCGESVIQDGANHVCPAGLRCEPQLIRHLTHYGSREALDIEHLGEKTSRQLVRNGLVRNLSDLYSLSTDDLMRLDGFAKKSAGKLHAAIAQSRRPPLDRFLYALGIKHVGQRAARVLADEFKSLKKLRSADVETLTRIHEIGPETAESVHSFFTESANQNVLRRMAKQGVEVQDMANDSSKAALKNKKFVFTGSLKKYTRAEAQRAVQRLGGRATHSVSGETDFLVVGKDPGSKLDEAKQHGTQILNEPQFNELLAGSGTRKLELA